LGLQRDFKKSTAIEFPGAMEPENNPDHDTQEMHVTKGVAREMDTFGKGAEFR
jgi:hypothetical protein